MAYRIAVAAAVNGGFSLAAAARDFVVASVGGVALGLALGLLLGATARRLRPNIAVDKTLFLLTPYAAYLLAEELHVSGVLAVVACGPLVARVSAPVGATQTRLAGYAVMDVLSFILTSLLFILVGLQLRPVLEALADDGEGLLGVLGRAASVLVGVIVVRLAWVRPATYVPRWVSSRLRDRDTSPPAGFVLIVAWTGMRGPVSLAAALSLPLVTASGAPFPARDVLVLITFVVILGTLVLQGLSLPALIRALGLHDDGSGEREEVVARVLVAAAALKRLEELSAEEWVREDTAQRLHGQYDFRRRRFQARQDQMQAGMVSADGQGDDSAEDDVERRSGDFQRLVRELLAAQRATALQLRREGRIGDEALLAIQRDLDMEDARLET